jgi:hypothetical protein
MRDELSNKNSSPVLILLTLAVVAGGALAVGSAATRQALMTQHAWLVMIGLALLVAPVSTVNIPGLKADVVVGDVVTFACAALFGANAAILAAVADGTLTSLRITKNSRKFIYNVATCAVSTGVANLVAHSAFDQFGSNGSQMSAGALAAALGLFTVVYFLMSTMLISTYIALSTRKPVIKLWKDKFLWTFVSYLGSGASAFAVALLAERMGHLVFLVSAGTMLALFLFYRAYFRRASTVALAHSTT